MLFVDRRNRRRCANSTSKKKMGNEESDKFFWKIEL